MGKLEAMKGKGEPGGQWGGVCELFVGRLLVAEPRE